MLEKIFLHLLIFCGIYFHGIIATFSDTRESSDLLVREKRVISHSPGRLQAIIHIEQANYMVNIRVNGAAHCAGAILSPHTVITAGVCVPLNVSNYKVVSSTGCEPNCFHNVTSKIEHYGNVPYEKYDGIALIRVSPPITFSQRARNILLHAGPLPTGTQVTVNGWGCLYPLRPSFRGIQRRLRTITLPIMNHAECQIIYRGRFNITAKNICTYDEDKYCAYTDLGAPLVYNGRLVGIHVYKGEQEGVKNPDVFVDLQRTDYSAWIRENTLLM